MSDYNFLKSGFGDDIKLSEKQQSELQSLVLLFAENALKSSAIYVEHAKRTIVQLRDIQNCMKVEAMLFCKKDNTIQQAKELLDDLLSLENGEEEDDIDDILTNDEEEFTLSTCNCPLCEVVNNIDSFWNKWEPETPLEKSLKKNINLFS